MIYLLSLISLSKILLASFKSFNSWLLINLLASFTLLFIASNSLSSTLVIFTFSQILANLSNFWYSSLILVLVFLIKSIKSDSFLLACFK